MKSTLGVNFWYSLKALGSLVPVCRPCSFFCQSEPKKLLSANKYNTLGFLCSIDLEEAPKNWRGTVKKMYEKNISSWKYNFNEILKGT